MSDNLYGFFDFSALIPAPFVTVQSTGSIGEAFVQMWPCGVTDDCLLLFPKHSEVDEEDLFIAASVLRLERWRFDYGRKMTPARIADFKMNRDPSLKQWIRQMRVPAEQLMSGTLHALANQPEPLDEIDMNLEEKFKLLARRWRQATGGQSSSSKITKHPAYLAIIELGMPVVPLILRSLEKRPELWFSALKTITEESPVSPGDAGNVAKMAQAWLQWGKDQHLIN